MAEAPWRITTLAPSDADEMGRVHMAVWREAYAGVMPAGYLAGLSDERASARWLERAGDAGLAEGTLVARDAHGELVGFASAGPPRDADAPCEVELYALNTLRRVHGSGLADELLRLAIGDRPTFLWVVEANRRARRFYARHGFAADGATSVHVATGTPEVRLVRR